MKKALIFALLLGSSSVALADTSYGFHARANITANFRGPVVRDHRSFEPVYVQPESRFDQYRYQEINRWEPARPIVVNADCANWDPMLDPASACDAYRTTDARPMPTTFGQWTVLATRESSVPDHQYVAVEKAVNRVRVDVVTGRPMFEKVAVRYMDGETHVFQLNGRTRGASFNVNPYKAVSAVVVYTADGSRGAYTISAS